MNVVGLTAVGALMVNVGVMIKNGLEQGGMAKKATEIIGMILFIVGWVIVALAIGMPDGKPMKALLSIVACTSIVLGVLLTKKLNKAHLGGPMFIGGWLALGYIIGMHREMNVKAMGMGAAALVILSMVAVLPFQRKHNIIDGPGMSLFTLAWVLITLASGTVSQKALLAL